MISLRLRLGIEANINILNTDLFAVNSIYLYWRLIAVYDFVFEQQRQNYPHLHVYWNDLHQSLNCQDSILNKTIRNNLIFQAFGLMGVSSSLDDNVACMYHNVPINVDHETFYKLRIHLFAPGQHRERNLNRKLKLRVKIESSLEYTYISINITLFTTGITFSFDLL